MGKKSEYRAYIQSEKWQTRRRTFLTENGKCNECGLPRYLSVLFFDEDLHVDHRNYQRVGEELDADLQALCKRCHELKHFGHTSLRDPSTGTCDMCDKPLWDRFSESHEHCVADEMARVELVSFDWDITVLRIASPVGRRKQVLELLKLLDKVSPGKFVNADIIAQIVKEFRES